jgi:hypothetical protein
MNQKKCVNPSWNDSGHTHVFLAYQLQEYSISSLVNFLSHTEYTKIYRKKKENIHFKKHELYEKSGMEGISVCGNCGGEELKNFSVRCCV